MNRPTLAACAALCLALGACATKGPPPEPKVEPHPYAVKVHEACEAPEPAQPDWRDSAVKIREAMASGPDAVAGAYAAGRKQHYAYEGELRAWGEGCAK